MDAQQNSVAAVERARADAERILDNALADFRSAAVGSLAREFYELRLQAAIFQYDVCYEFSAFWRANPKGFAEKVALRNVVHKLYEYDVALASRITRRVLELARRRELPIDGEDIKREKNKWKEELAVLRQWSDVRSQTIGHYGKDINRQVCLIETLEHNRVLDVARAFLAFNNYICKVLANVGTGHAGA